MNMRVHPIFCLISIVRFASGLQYCHEDVSVPVHFCVAIAERYNATSASKDLVVTLGHRMFSENGWVGLGIGGGMAGALLFVGYMVGEEPVLSVRHGKGHFQPHPDAKVGSIYIAELSRNSTDWFQASLVCFAYDNQWTQGRYVDMNNLWQPFIWSANPWQELHSALPDAGLTMHSTYGHFAFDMNQQHANTSLGISEYPRIDFARGNQGVKDSSSNQHDNAELSWSSTILRVHGYVLTLATTVLFPAGAICIKCGWKTAFQFHVLLQTIGASLSALGAVLSISAICYTRAWYLLHEPHILIGGLLIVTIAVQGLLGHLHHQAYKAETPLPKLTNAHKTLGRLLPLFCCVNALLGLRLAGNSTSSIVLVSFIGSCDTAIVLVLFYRSRGETSSTKAEIDNEDSLGLLQSHA